MKLLQWSTILGIFIIAKLILHLYLNDLWSFHRDELLYLALGKRLDWGFASVPPGIGFWSWFGNNVFGGSVWGIRLISTVFGTATVLLTGLMAKEMLPKESYGRYAMVLVGLAGLVCGAYLRPCMLFMPVVFDVFYWTLLCWIFLKYLNTENSNWLLWFGIVTGIGLLNKYSVLIFLFAMLPGLLFTRQRKIFSDKKLYIAIGLALLVFSPNILWQADHRFPVFRHMTELAATQFAHVTLGSFFGDQVRFFLPAVPVWVCGLYYLLFRSEAKPWRMFGWMFCMVLLVLLAFSAKSYYSLGAYPVLIAAGAAFIERVTKNKYKWIRYAIPAFMILGGVASFPVALPIFSPVKEAEFVKHVAQLPGLQGILRWEDGNYYALPQDYADMIGWEEIGEEAGKVWQSIQDKSGAAIYADSYGQAGAIEHFGKAYGVNEVLSFNESYQYWLPDSLPAHFHTLIYINDELGDDMPGFFTQIEKKFELDMPLSRQHGDQIYLCTGPTPAFFERIGTAIRNAKMNEEIED